MPQIFQYLVYFPLEQETTMMKSREVKYTLIVMLHARLNDDKYDRLINFVTLTMVDRGTVSHGYLFGPVLNDVNKEIL